MVIAQSEKAPAVRKRATRAKASVSLSEPILSDSQPVAAATSFSGIASALMAASNGEREPEHWLNDWLSEPIRQRSRARDVNHIVAQLRALSRPQSRTSDVRANVGRACGLVVAFVASIANWLRCLSTGKLAILCVTIILIVSSLTD